MSTSLFDEPAVRPSTSPAQRLRSMTAAVRLAISWFGVRKTLTTDQKNQAAESFGAQGNFISAGKKLLDTTHPAFKAVTAVKNKSVNFWKSLSLPYTEPGIRLIRQDKIEMFDGQMRSFQEELDEAAAALDRRYHDLKVTAQRRLGQLYDPSDR